MDREEQRRAYLLLRDLSASKAKEDEETVPRTPLQLADALRGIETIVEEVIGTVVKWEEDDFLMWNSD